VKIEILKISLQKNFEEKICVRLEMYRKIVDKLKIVVCGGDGSVGWILSTLDSLRWPVYPPISVIPLGTGNDLAQTLGWGATYIDEPLTDILLSVTNETTTVYMDRFIWFFGNMFSTTKMTQNSRWLLETEPNDDVPQKVNDDEATNKLPLTVMNNYFSIGSDAQAALQFHESRSTLEQNQICIFKPECHAFVSCKPRNLQQSYQKPDFLCRCRHSGFIQAIMAGFARLYHFGGIVNLRFSVSIVWIYF